MAPASVHTDRPDLFYLFFPMQNCSNQYNPTLNGSFQQCLCSAGELLDTSLVQCFQCSHYWLNATQFQRAVEGQHLWLFPPSYIHLVGLYFFFSNPSMSSSRCCAVRQSAEHRFRVNLTWKRCTIDIRSHDRLVGSHYRTWYSSGDVVVIVSRSISPGVEISWILHM